MKRSIVTLIVGILLTGSGLAQDSLGVRCVGRLDSSAFDVVREGEIAYVTGDILRILDVSDPANPEEIGVCQTGVRGLAVSGDYVYIAGAQELIVVNVSDSAHP